jgi:hypothetical protein
MMQVVDAHIARPLFHDAPAERAGKNQDGDKRCNSAHDLHSFSCAKVVSLKEPAAANSDPRIS